MLLSSLMQVITTPFSAGKVRVEVKFPLTTPSGCARKFPGDSLLAGTSVISPLPEGNFQKTTVPGRVHWRTTSSPEHGKSTGDCCVRSTSLQAGEHIYIQDNDSCGVKIRIYIRCS